MEEDKSVEVLDEMVAPEKKVIVSKVNEDKIIEGPSKVVKSKHGKGKIALTIDAICTGVVAIFEILREILTFYDCFLDFFENIGKIYIQKEKTSKE